MKIDRSTRDKLVSAKFQLSQSKVLQKELRRPLHHRDLKIILLFLKSQVLLNARECVRITLRNAGHSNMLKQMVQTLRLRLNVFCSQNGTKISQVMPLKELIVTFKRRPLMRSSGSKRREHK
jgi:hypothetical protein